VVSKAALAVFTCLDCNSFTADMNSLERSRQDISAATGCGGGVELTNVDPDLCVWPFLSCLLSEEPELVLLRRAII